MNKNLRLRQSQFKSKDLNHRNMVLYCKRRNKIQKIIDRERNNICRNCNNRITIIRESVHNYNNK